MRDHSFLVSFFPTETQGWVRRGGVNPLVEVEEPLAGLQSITMVTFFPFFSIEMDFLTRLKSCHFCR